MNAAAQRILITGGGSYMGRHLVPIAAQFHEVGYSFYHRDRLGLPTGEYVDVRQETAVIHLVTRFRPQVIIHTVGSNRGRRF